jgi:hypothetical protein
LPLAQGQQEFIDLTEDSDEESSPAALHARPDGDASAAVSINKARRQPDSLTTKRPIGHHSVVNLASSSRSRPRSLVKAKVQTESLVPHTNPSATNTHPSIATLAMPPLAIPLGPYISLDSHDSYAGTQGRRTPLESPMPTARRHGDGFHQSFPTTPQPRYVPYLGPIHHIHAQGTIPGARPAIPTLPASSSAAPACFMSTPQPLKFISNRPIAATTTVTAGFSPRVAQSLLPDERQQIDRLEKEFAAQKVTNTYLEDRLAKLNLKHRDVVRERDDHHTKWEAVKQQNLVLKQDNVTLVARFQELENEAEDLDITPEDQQLAVHLAEESWLEEQARSDRYKKAYEELQAKGTKSHNRSDPSATIQQFGPAVNRNVPDPLAEIVDRRLTGMISVTAFILSRDNKYLKQPPFVVSTQDVPTKRALATLARSKIRQTHGIGRA